MLNEELDNLKIFENTILIELSNGEDNLTKSIDKFINLTISHNSSKLCLYSIDIRQFYVLYVLTKRLFEYSLDNKDMLFFDNVCYPNIINSISIYLNSCKRILGSLVKTCYKDICNKSRNIVDFYLLISNSESIIIQNDILLIFLKEFFVLNSPLELKDFKNYYSSVLKYLYYSYLKNRTHCLIEEELDSTILMEEEDMMTTSRYKIYEGGVRLSQIQYICTGSQTLSVISKNYENIRNNIINNELQKIYFHVIEKDHVTDSKQLVMRSNLDNIQSLNKLREKLPLIYRLLRSVRVRGESFFSEKDKKLIHDSIYTVLYIKLKEKLDEPKAKYLATNISLNLSRSLINGRYVDPYSMESVNISCLTFVNQLKSFLKLIVESL
jgi:hypothetical protein